MQRTVVNPWSYPEGLDQGVMIEGHRRLLFVSGQCSVSPEGESRHPGDMRAQTLLALDNVAAVLDKAGMSLADIVRMNTHVTDVDAFFEHAGDALADRLAEFDVRPPGVLSGTTRLGRPDLLVEIEVIAAD
ncbi:enamine deaminase RidA (YjgF/YER057c/UK114 family) [Murinocardiopsis flavida]|uniref:Enamine deaminase RidA (YjgF/YER057c/UK114 family) n=1 Tax=Murinocardiopsis flavida TaxID=645275 RepID=A0A2P8DU62_9ACTN|nr:RidA family protein [Murinocardiopsis flavida]PSL00758.1 enamine deaminase RidA (YjgF/YER057c/UK114 family) [Murinocardiopsis flavida]